MEKLNKAEELLNNNRATLEAFTLWERNLKDDLTNLNHYIHSEKPFTYFICDLFKLYPIIKYDFENYKPKELNNITFIEEYKIINLLNTCTRLDSDNKRVFSKEEILNKINNKKY